MKLTISPKKILKNRSKHLKASGYNVTEHEVVAAGNGADAPIVSGMTIAITESLNNQRMTAEFRAETPELHGLRTEFSADPAWFFRLNRDKWEFIGFGNSTETLMEPGLYDKP